MRPSAEAVGANRWHRRHSSAMLVVPIWHRRLVKSESCPEFTLEMAAIPRHRRCRVDPGKPLRKTHVPGAPPPGIVQGQEPI
jgi:hypothetical protein